MSKIVASIKVGIEISSLSTISKALSESYGPNVKMRQSGELLEFFLDASEGSPERGTERTTKQMRLAEKNALYVWPNDLTKHEAIVLCQGADRNDLEIVGPSQFNDDRIENLRGRMIPEVVIDHATKFTVEQQRNYDWLKAMIRLNQSLMKPC